MRKIVVTGHRPETLDSWWSYCAEMMSWISQNRQAIYLLGTARGTDMYAGLACVQFKIPFQLHMTYDFETLTANWKKHDTEMLRMLKQRACLVKIHFAEKTLGAHDLRDIAMIDDATEMYSLYDGRSEGGTAKAVKYARSRGLPIAP